MLENAPDTRILELLDRLREADATVDEVALPDGTSRLFVTMPFDLGLDALREGSAA
jgi:hypothetical protein